jgi:hypothetical protein
MTNPDVTAILSSLLAGSTGQTAYQAPAPVVPNPDLASILQSLSGQPPPLPVQQPAIATNLDLSALLSQFQQQQAPPTQRWTSPPPTTTRTRWDERPRESERSTKKRERDVGSRIKASRLDDIRNSVRNSTADQNVYRALCQFYVFFPRYKGWRLTFG